MNQSRPAGPPVAEAPGRRRARPSKRSLAWPTPRDLGPWEPFQWTCLVVVLAVLNGVVGVFTGVGLGLALLFRARPRHLQGAAAGLLALAALSTLAEGLPSRDTLSATWVLENVRASNLAFAGFAFLVTGLVLDAIGRAPGGAREHEPATERRGGRRRPPRSRRRPRRRGETAR